MYTRWVNCKNFTPVVRVPWLAREEKTCADCDNFRENCHDENCPDCKDVLCEFFCAIDKQEI